MERRNEMKLEFEALSVNEGFARVAVAAFCARMNPTLDELEDIKTAVSEAVTNAIIHGYEEKEGTVVMQCCLSGSTVHITVKDSGKGIADIERAKEPFFTTRPELERSGMGFSFMEAFMDEVEVRSKVGEGTVIKMKKIWCGKVKWRMEQTIAYIKRAHKGDKQARDTLVLGNQGLVWSVVQRFLGRGHDKEELFQIGCIGLMKAVDKFDVSYEVCFSTYAVPVIMGEIRRFLRDDGMVKVSRSMKEKGYLISNARKELTDMLGREPELKELAEKTGLSEEEIVLAVEANGEVESIYQSVYQSDGSEIYLLDRLKDKKNAQEELENKLLIEELLQQLSGREQQLIKMRYFENATQSQIAAKLGTSQVQVSRMEKKILLQMRKYMSQG